MALKRILLSMLLVLCASYALCGEGGPLPLESDTALINVRSLGAKGDGETDDTEAVARAISEGMTTGKTVYFPKGTYMISKPIRITAHGFSMRGDGPQHSVIKAAAEMDRLLYLRGSGIVISRLMLHAGGKAVYGLHAFHLNEQDSRLEFLRVVQAKSHGFFLDHSQCMEVANSVAQGNGGDGFHITDCNATTIRHCRAIENSERGFHVTTTDLSGGCYLLQCDAELNGMEGLFIESTHGTPTVVQKMWCETNNPTGSGDNLYDAVRIVSRSVVMAGCRISTRGDDPARSKYAVRLAADTRLDLSQFSGAFQTGETVTGTQSGASGLVDAWQADPLFSEDFPIPKPYLKWLERPRKLLLRDVSGEFARREKLTGTRSGAKGTVANVSTVAAENCSLRDNWIARESGRAPVERIYVEAGCANNKIEPPFRMWSPGEMPVEYEK